MPINAQNVSGELILLLDTQTGTGDKQVLKTRSYRQVKPDASPKALYTVGEQLISLQTMPKVAIRHRVLTELSEE